MKVFAIRQYIITITFLVLVILFFTIIYIYATNTINEKQQTYLIKENELMESEVIHFFHNTEITLNTVAAYIKVQGTDGLLDFLVGINQDHEQMASLYFLSKDNELFNSTGFVPPAHIDLRTRIWYTGATNQNGIYFSPAFVNSSLDRIIVTVSRTVYLDSEFLGVIASDIDIRSIQHFLSNYKVGDKGYILLVDQNHHLLSHQNHDPSNLTLISYTEISNETLSLSGNGFLANYHISEQEGVIAYRTILNDSYTLIAYMPLTEYRYANDIFFSFYTLLSIAIVILGTAHMIFNQKHVFSPFKLLIRDIEKIDTLHDINYRLHERKKGFGELREKLNLALDSTSHYFKIAQDSNRELLYENQRVKLLMSSTADIIFEIDMNLEFESVFGKGLSKINMTPEDFIGKTVLELFGKNGIERYQIYEQAIKGKSATYRWEWKSDSNHEILYFESSISPIYDEKNEIVGAVGISRDITESKKRQDEIDYINCHDFLTGLYNRRYYHEMLDQMDQESYYPIGVMNLDLNGLKILNDAYGHDYGDLALKKIGKILGESINSNSIVARIGGDEFAAIVPNTSTEHMYSIKMKVKNAIKAVSVENIELSIAVGYEIKMDPSNTMEEILKSAENQMYRNKLAEGKSVRNNSIRAIHKTLTDKYEEERIHSEKVSQMCKQMGKALGIKDEDLKELEMAGMYHDIGKISIPDAILKKADALTHEEIQFIRMHSESGYQILRAADEYTNLAEYALSHHEKWDGTGYPKGLKGEETPLYSRIIGICDAFEAMTADRVYRKKLSDEEALRRLKEGSGTQFDPNLVEIFIKYVLKEQ
jgi:diguanylate cyclase (GGDEF)-like protein/PAS domain S-box-containing protein